MNWGALLKEALSIALVLWLVSPAMAEEKRSDLADQQQVAVTIYNENLALVRDQRKVTLDEGEDHLALREVSARIMPETALLRSLSHSDDFHTIEQNFDFDLLTPQKLLEKYVGRTVEVVKVHPQTGKETRESAQVLAANNGVVLRMQDRIETGVPGRLVYPDVPENLRDRPTLVVQLNSGTDSPQLLELTYLTGGLSWRADYVAELNKSDDMLNLSGLVTLTNQSGASYRNAHLQLVAGDVHRIRPELLRPRDFMVEEAMAKAAAPQMKEEEFFEYHLYTLDRPTTIKENQTKQVALLSASGIPAAKEYMLKGLDYYYFSSYGELGQKLKVGVFIEFENREEASLGIPLPKGIVRVYKKDEAGATQFVGEDRIDHTPKNEKVRLKLGEAFDITADKKQTDFKKLGGFGKFRHGIESAYQIDLKNAKKENVTVRVVEPIPGEWEVIEQSHPHSKETAGTAVWQVEVPAEGKATLTYRVRVRY